MVNEMQKLLDEYAKWLKDRTTLKQINEWVEITTPFVDRHNDLIQFYVKKDGEKYLLSDDGYTLNDLEQNGCKLTTPKRKDLLKLILNGFGATEDNGQILLSATQENFAFQKHNMVQALLAINDMFFLSAPTVASLFYEDVVEWLDTRDIRYTPNVQFTGRSGYLHSFDFVIPKSRRQPERILRAIANPDKNAAQMLAFAWFDTKDVRASDAKAYAILDDTERKVPHDVQDALANYEVKPVKWSERDSVEEELVA